MSDHDDAATPRSDEDAPQRAEILSPESIRAIRLGHGGNCSSVGSVIDVLFLSAAIGGAMFAAVCAAMSEEPVRVVGVQEGSSPHGGVKREEDDTDDSPGDDT